MKTILKYPGAKNRLADWICGQMPEHDVYVELFGGSAAVLLNKRRCHIETLNDIDGEIVNFFSVVRDNPEELMRSLRFTPFAREEYKKAFEYAEEPVERARRFCVRCWQGFGNSQVYQNGFKSGQQRTSPNPAKAWTELPEVVSEASERLAGVQIENLPAVEVLKRYNTKDVFVYADPPYLPELRKNYLYKHEMDKEEHIELLVALKEHPGPVMISGYDNTLYNELLKGWRKSYKSTTAECGYKRTEVIWKNYETNSQLSIFDYGQKELGHERKL